MRLWLATALVVGTILCVAGTAQAGTFHVEDGDFKPTFGGEFAITKFTGPLGNIYDGVNLDKNFKDDGADFHTFCIETSEPIMGGNDYYFELNDEALFNDVPGNSNPLEVATAKLFYAFWTNNWVKAEGGAGAADDLAGPGYAYYGTTAKRLSDAEDLQRALWKLEGQNSGPITGTKAVDYIAWAQQVTWKELGGDWDEKSIGAVQVMNNYDLNDQTFKGRKQDFLVVVPLPAAALMGFSLLGVLGIGTVRRRRRA